MPALKTEDLIWSHIAKQKGGQRIMKDKIDEIRKAMHSLGYTSGRMSIETLDEDGSIAMVFYEGECFGIYNFDRHTFVD